MSIAAASANSWLRPPLPSPRIVTVVSPPEMTQAGRRDRPVKSDQLFRDGGVHSRDIAGLALNEAGENHGVIAESVRMLGRGSQGKIVAANNDVPRTGKCGIVLLRSLRRCRIGQSDPYRGGNPIEQLILAKTATASA